MRKAWRDDEGGDDVDGENVEGVLGAGVTDEVAATAFGALVRVAAGPVGGVCVCAAGPVAGFFRIAGAAPVVAAWSFVFSARAALCARRSARVGLLSFLRFLGSAGVASLLQY